jgi:hypothetical protein
MSTTDPRRERETSTGAYGVSVFAGVILVTLASFQILEGLSAVLKDDLYVAGLKYAYAIDLTTWGWIHLVIGVIGVAVGIGILAGQAWGHILGIAFAVISALSQFMFLPFYPFWALLLIGMNILVIWALANRLTET